MSKPEGMPAALKALDMVRELTMIEITDEELEEFASHVRRSDTTHGLLWGSIPNFRQESNMIDAMKMLVEIGTTVKKWKADKRFVMAYILSVNRAGQN